MRRVVPLATVAVLVVVVAALVLSWRSVPAAPPVVPDRTYAGYAPTPEVERLLVPEDRYYGLAVDGLPDDRSAVSGFSSLVGRSPNMLMTFQSWSEDFDVPALEALSRDGHLPIVSWEPWDHTRPDADPFPLREVAGGRFDAYLREQARALGAMDGVVAIRLAHEMNAYWYPWGQLNAHENSPEEYVAMFRHVRDVFEAEGVDNVIWVWSPNLVEPVDDVPLAELYPGDVYVDWVGVVGYLIDPDPHYGFDKVYARTLAEIEVFAPDKPIVLTETAVSPQEVPLDRSRMVRDLFAGIGSNDDIVGFVWFNIFTPEKRADWRLENDPAAAATFRSEVRSGFGGVSSHLAPAVPEYVD